MRKVTVRFTEEQFSKLKRLAAERGTSRSQVIRDELRRYAQQHGLDLGG